MTKSLRIASEDLGLDGVAIIYPGDRYTRVAERTWLLPLSSLTQMTDGGDLAAALTRA